MDDLNNRNDLADENENSPVSEVNAGEGAAVSEAAEGAENSDVEVTAAEESPDVEATSAEESSDGEVTAAEESSDGEGTARVESEAASGGPAYGDSSYSDNADYVGDFEPAGKGVGNVFDKVKGFAGSLAGGGEMGDPDGDRRKKIIIGAALALCALLAFMLIINGVSRAVKRAAGAGQETAAASDASDASDAADTSSTVESAAVLPAEGADISGMYAVAEVAAKAMPSIVSVTNVSEIESSSFFGESTRHDSVSSGSGIITDIDDTEVIIAANNNVISYEGEVTVAFADGTTAPASVIGTDADNDLALLSVAAADLAPGTKDRIYAVAIGDSDALVVGEPVVTAGSAPGYGQSVSFGIVSSLGRVIKDSDGGERTVIQTDASVNPGNSGGALLNMRGELVGINDASLTDSKVEGMGYAIPVNDAKTVLSSIRHTKARTSVPAGQESYLGITCMTMPEFYTQTGYPKGVYVDAVAKKSPAEEAGIRSQDIITAVDGKSVFTQEELLEEVALYAAGEEMTLSVSRLGEDKEFEKLKVKVILGARDGAVVVPAADEEASSVPEAS